MNDARVIACRRRWIEGLRFGLVTWVVATGFGLGAIYKPAASRASRAAAV